MGANSKVEWCNDTRIPILLNTPPAVRLLSCEPLLGPVNLAVAHRKLLADLVSGAIKSLPIVDWVIAGGESGPQSRPMQPEWVRGIRDQCAAAGIPFFFKQWGGNQKINHAWGGDELDGQTHKEMPAVFA